MNRDVLLAYIRPEHVDGNFFDSWTQLLIQDLTRPDGRIFDFVTKTGNNGELAEARNECVKMALAIPGWQWLWWMDTDGGWDPFTLEKLISTAHPAERPIVGALCFANKEVAKDGMHGFRIQPRVTISDYVDMEDGSKGFAGRQNYPINSVIRCDSTGMHCVLIHRWVFEKIADEYGPVWHDRITIPQGRCGEDTSFFMRAGAVGAPVHINTAIKTNHQKTRWLSEDDWFDYKTITNPVLDLPKPLVAIPVKNRWDLTRPLLEELIAQGEADEIIVYDNGSTDGTKAGMVELAHGSSRLSYVNAHNWKLHGMWNRALEAAKGRPVAILNNDLKIGSEFLSRQVFALANDPRLAVVSPNYDGRIPGTWFTNQIAAGRMDGSGGIAGFAFMVAADFADTYRFPHELNWWFGDNHLVASALLEGRKAAVIGGVSVEHIDGGGNSSGSVMWDDPKYAAAIKADRDWFQRWLEGQ